MIHACDRWCCAIFYGQGDGADRVREAHKLAEEADPSLGGFGLLEARGPDGLVADESARRIFFGERPK